jgi:hypothetical protein
MAPIPDRSRTLLEGQNIRPPLGSFFNGQSYWIRLHPEMGRSSRSVMVVTMVLQFQFSDGDGGSWTSGEKDGFAHAFVDGVVSIWADKFRITTTSTVPVASARDVGVIFDFPYYIDGWHSDDDFELSVTKIPSGGFQVSSCGYSLGNSDLDSEDIVAVGKGASMPQRGVVHEFGHMLGLRDEYPEANDNRNHLGDLDSIMNAGEVVRKRHYAPFAAWLTDKFEVAGHLAGSAIRYKVEGDTDLSNAFL